jgi:transposase-like protein
MPRCSVCQHLERQDIEADLRGGTSYRDIARRYNLSKDALARHKASHMSRHTETGLAAAKEIITLLNKAETSPSWNSTLLAVRATRGYVEELLVLNLTVPASRAVGPGPNAK